MFVHTQPGKLIHRSDDGKTTLCGRNCADWWKDNEGNYIYNQPYCERCGTPEQHEAHKREMAEASRQRSEQQAAERQAAQIRFARRIENCHELLRSLEVSLASLGLDITEARALPAGWDMKISTVVNGSKFEVRLNCTA